jgi:hypothetical protein
MLNKALIRLFAIIYANGVQFILIVLFCTFWRN